MGSAWWARSRRTQPGSPRKGSARLGFTTFSARGQLRVAVRLSRWLVEAGLDAEALTTAAAHSLLAARRAAGDTAYLTPKALVPLLVVPAWAGRDP